MGQWGSAIRNCAAPNDVAAIIAIAKLGVILPGGFFSRQRQWTQAAKDSGRR
jgi:hypothetical protein